MMMQNYHGEYYDVPHISDLMGQVFTSVTHNGDEMVFENDTMKFTFYHEQDCCEDVRIEDIAGDLDDLVGSPILLAEQVSNETVEEEDEYMSQTWTFYKFATIKGYVDVRWHGTSNGYYSESVDVKKVMKSVS